MDASVLVERLQPHFPDVSFEAADARDQPTIFVPREALVDACRVLRDEPSLNFSLLADLTAVDWLNREPRFEVVYHLACLAGDGAPASVRRAKEAGGAYARLRMKVRVPGEDPRMPTVCRIWPAAEWAEREVWDLFGIVFEGHPDLRRILTPDEWEGHPLRKDYPVQVDLPVRSTEALQVSEQEFIANIRAARVTGRPPAGPGERDR